MNTTQTDLNKVKWKTELCPTGESCWCRCITTETPILKDGLELYIAPAGSIPKENAEHIVKVHNFFLFCYDWATDEHKQAKAD